MNKELSEIEMLKHILHYLYIELKELDNITSKFDPVLSSMQKTICADICETSNKLRDLK